MRSTQSRPVHPLLPWHHAVRDGNGKLLPWYRPNAGLGYDRVLRLGWNFIEHGVPRDPRTRSKVYLNYAVFDGQVAPRHLLAAQSGVSQRCVRRLADLLVSIFGRPAGDRRGARDARLPARTRNFAGGLGVATGPVHHGLRGRANVWALPRRAPPALLRRRRDRQGGAARPRISAVLRADRRTAVPSRCDRSRERARKTRSPG
jgi:hypothetical protein